MPRIIITFFLLLFTINLLPAMNSNINEKQLVFEFTVNAPVEEVYSAWTTPEGIKSFFAPGCEVEMKLFGSYYIYFFPDSPAGQRGAEDEVLISYEPNKMVSFTWGFPPLLMNLRQNQKTVVRIRFSPTADDKTKVLFIQSGWGESEEWQKGFDYFTYAWGNVILARLQYRFVHGPIDWNNMPDVSDYALAK